MMQGSSTWVIWLSAVLVNAVVILMCGVCIAYQRKKLAAAKRRLDRFNMRFKVFDAARTYLGKATHVGSVTVDDVRAFHLATLDASILLNDEVAAYLNEITERVSDMMGLRATREDQSDSPSGVSAAEKLRRVNDWLIAQIDVLPTKFKPFLKLDG